MDFEKAKVAVRELKKHNTRKIVLIGGEPTIYMYFLELVKLIHENGMNSLYELGYQNIIGIDIADILINEAMQYSRNRGLFIDFRNMDASKLLFENSTFDLAFFSYNGLTGIPTQKRRLDVMNEIYRTLKLGGYFIFTAHDRNSESTNITFWKNERERWKKGKNNPVLYEYGDVLVKNGEAQEFLHYYSREEMEKLILQTQFKIVEVKMRSEIAKESEKVKSFSKETCFWVLKK